MKLSEIQKLVYEEYKKNGYAKRWTKEYLIEHPDELDLVIDLAEVGLIITEIAELMEEIRDGNLPFYAEEGADIMIRTMNFFNRKGLDLEQPIMRKHEKNLKRKDRHGRKV